MTDTRKPIRKNPIPAKLAGQIYLDPTYDPAFKALFGDEGALKDFLDGVLNLEGDDRIKTLRFRFDEPLVFHMPQEKKVILDIFATTGSGRIAATSCRRQSPYGFAILTCPAPVANISTNGHCTAPQR